MTSSGGPRFLLSLLLTCLCGAGANNSNYLRPGARQVVSQQQAGVSLTDDASRHVEKKNSNENSAFPPIPPFPKPTKDGIGFTRKISQLDSNTTLSLTFGGGQCKSKDEYGNNACHYNWGDAIEANYTLKLAEALQEGDTLRGHVKIDHVVPYSFSCAVCGADCVLKIPVPVVQIEWSFPTRPCPISTDMIVDTFIENLGDHSPTDGIPVHIEGNLQIVRGTSGDTAAKFSLSVDIK